MRVSPGQGPLRVLAILEAGDLYPSGTVRGLIYRKYFERDGIEIRFVSRIHLPIRRLMDSPPRWLRFMLRFGVFAELMTSINRRLTRRCERAALAAAKHYDVVYMSKVTSFAFVKSMRRATAARLVLDFGDAVWLPRWRIDRFDETLKTVDAITTDNALTAAYVRQFNPNCTVIPDCPNIEEFDRARSTVRKAAGRRVVLGWVGSRSSAFNLYVVWEALERVFARHESLELRLMGVASDNLPPFERVRYSCVPTYDQAQMIEEVLKMDIGLFPLQDVEACRVRGVLKGAIYMSGEVAVVCSPVGQCIDLIQDGVNGMLASSTEDWEEKLEKLIVNQNLRRKIAHAGLETVRSQFTVAKSYPLLKSVLEG